MTPIEGELAGPGTIWDLLRVLLPMAILVSAFVGTLFTLALAPFISERERQSDNDRRSGEGQVIAHTDLKVEQHRADDGSARFWVFCDACGWGVWMSGILG